MTAAPGAAGRTNAIRAHAMNGPEVQHGSAEP
jgi:hypothetical protein